MVHTHIIHKCTEIQWQTGSWVSSRFLCDQWISWCWCWLKNTAVALLSSTIKFKGPAPKIQQHPMVGNHHFLMLHPVSFLGPDFFHFTKITLLHFQSHFSPLNVEHCYKLLVYNTKCVLLVIYILISVFVEVALFFFVFQCGCIRKIRNIWYVRYVQPVEKK